MKNIPLIIIQNLPDDIGKITIHQLPTKCPDDLFSKSPFDKDFRTNYETLREIFGDAAQRKILNGSDKWWNKKMNDKDDNSPTYLRHFINVVANHRQFASRKVQAHAWQTMLNALYTEERRAANANYVVEKKIEKEKLERAKEKKKNEKKNKNDDDDMDIEEIEIPKKKNKKKEKENDEEENDDDDEERNAKRKREKKLKKQQNDEKKEKKDKQEKKRKKENDDDKENNEKSIDQTAKMMEVLAAMLDKKLSEQNAAITKRLDELDEEKKK